MKIPPRSEAEALRLSKREPLKAGWHDNARITEAVEKLSKSEKDMIETTVVVVDADGNERTLRDWLNGSALGAAKLRHACEAVGALARYEAGEISAADFPGHDVRVKIGIEKRRGYPDRNQIEDYAAAAVGLSRIVNLRGAG